MHLVVLEMSDLLLLGLLAGQRRNLGQELMRDVGPCWPKRGSGQMVDAAGNIAGYGRFACVVLSAKVVRFGEKALQKKERIILFKLSEKVLESLPFVPSINNHRHHEVVAVVRDRCDADVHR